MVKSLWPNSYFAIPLSFFPSARQHEIHQCLECPMARREMKRHFFVAFSFAQSNTHLSARVSSLLCCLFRQSKRREFQFRRLACALPHTHQPTARAQYIRGRDCRRYCDIYWKTCKGAKYKYRLMVRAIMRFPQHQKEQSTTLLLRQMPGKHFFLLRRDV